MTVVVGTAGHIDHGKTTLLRALTGIDADRLPEERRRGMTIDVGFAHLDLPDGTSIDFVDVPGHDRLVGNMLVGAGEIDAALLVVAADEGPKAQTVEHLELLDALGIDDGIAVLTKADRLGGGDGAREGARARVAALLAGTSLASVPVLVASAETGEGLPALRQELLALRDRVVARSADEVGRTAARLPIDRVFSVQGRGTVVTGTLRGGALSSGTTVRILPGPVEARIREVQVHGRRVETADHGRAAVNLAAVDRDDLQRGMVLTLDPLVEVSDRLIVRLRSRARVDVGGRGAEGPGRGPGHLPADVPEGPAMGLRLHLGTAQVAARIARGSRTLVAVSDGGLVCEVRLGEPLAVAPGDRFVLRHPSPGRLVAGGVVLDPRPPRGVARRRTTPERLAALATADPRRRGAALLELHGSVPADSWRALGDGIGDATGSNGARAGGLVLARDVLDAVAADACRRVVAHHTAEPASAGIPVGELRTAVALALRRRVSASPPDASGAASAIIDGLVTAGRLARDGDTVRDPGRAEVVPAALAAAMDRLESMLSVAAPPPFADAVAASSCPPEGVRRLEQTARIVRLDPQLAYATSTYRGLATRALELARTGPLTPSAFRDATGTSRRYVLAILEDLDRRGVLSRGPDGHLAGPRADVPGALP